MCSRKQISIEKGEHDLTLFKGRPRRTLTLEQMEELRLIESIEIANETKDIIQRAKELNNKGNR
jgi:hypothetical protein